jgi:2'-5' RNA ligase
VIRLFVALEIPGIVRERLSLLQAGVPGARWMSPEQFHLTLRFVGEVDEVVAQDIDDSLRALRAPAFSLELAGVGEFGGKLPRALWAGTRPNPELLHLQKKVETALHRIGVVAAERKFIPHVTLARLHHSPGDKVVEFLAHNSLFASGNFDVTQFALFSSRLGGAGAVYSVERIYSLN